jgi:hypothetical protein
MSAPAAAPDVFGVTLPARPYPGLRPFGKDEWPIFFGREQMADEVVSRLVHQRLLVVHGDSGCGKSSLIRAGVLPRLEQDTARGGTRWITRVMTPGDEPLPRLAEALAEVPAGDEKGGHDAEARQLRLRRILNCGRDGSAALVDEVCGRRDAYVCLLVDQFEELFAHARRRGPQQASLLIDQLLGLRALGSDRLFVVLTMRSEFLGACAQFEGFAAAVNETQYLLPRMGHADLVRAIREPATLYDGEITLDLAERLIAEARGSQDELPLIQHGLMRLHDLAGRPERAWRLTLADYPQARGLAGLLSDHADEAMARVEPDDRGREGTRVTEDLFRALTDINADGQATRYPRRLRDLMAIAGADEATVRRVVDAFRAEGVSFMRPYGLEPIALDDSVDISHEALIRCWARIAAAEDGWLIREFKNGLVWRSLLVQADSFERDASNILSPATAEERERWLKRRNPAWAERYGGGWARVEALVVTSVAQRQRQMQAEIDARARDEQLKLREEQARLQEATLRSELAVAREKSRRVTLFRWGIVVSLVLTALAATAAEVARRERIAAEEAQSAATLAALEATNAADNERAKARVAQRAADTISAELAKLRLAAAAAPADSALRRQIDQAGSTIEKGVDTLLSPRIYLHIADESQRPAARALTTRIEANRIDGKTLIVPGVQRVANAPRRAELRCFLADECRVYGLPLLHIVNTQLQTPQVTLRNFADAETAGTVRPLHFEIFFPAGRIELTPQDAKAGY